MCVCVSSITFQYVWGMWYIMCRCVRRVCVCVCHISLMLLLPTASTILLSFCCILLSSLFCCCCCWFICCLPLERLLLISGWLGLSSVQLSSVQFSSVQLSHFPHCFLLISYLFFVVFSLLVFIFICHCHGVCVWVCAPTCFWLDTSHTRTYTRIHMRHTHTRRQAHGHSVGSTHRTARFGRFIYIVCVWYISIPYPLPLPHSAPTLALSAYTMVMCVGVCW